MSSLQVLIDSDAFVGRFYPNDAHHQAANQIFDRLQSERIYSVTTSMVIDEVATVLGHRQGQDLARLFLRTMEETRFPIIFIDERIREVGYRVFVAQNERGTSVTDCCNIAVMRRLNIPQIFAFDHVYRKVFQLQVLH